MFAAHQKTSSGQGTRGPQPIRNYSNVDLQNKTVPLADPSPLKTQDQVPIQCFYCNHRSYSSNEFNYHMVQKHSFRFPFTCQFCDYGSQRIDCVLWHMQKMHPQSAAPSAAPSAAQSAAPSAAPSHSNLIIKHPVLSNALHGPTGTSVRRSSVSPLAQLTATCSETILKRMHKAGHRGEMAKANALPKDQTELFAPLNQRIENHKALTIALPKEMTIPAGSFVELIEVNDINGKKELKLKVVQPNESLVNGCRDTAPQRFTVHSAAASSTATLTPTTSTTPTRKKPWSVGTCTANRLTLKRNNCHQPVSRDEELLKSPRNQPVPSYEESLKSPRNQPVPSYEESLKNLRNQPVPSYEESLQNLRNQPVPSYEESLKSLRNQPVYRDEESLRNLRNHFIQTTAKDTPRQSNSKVCAVRPLQRQEVAAQPSQIQEALVKYQQCVSPHKVQPTTATPITHVATVENIQGKHSSGAYRPAMYADPSHPSLRADQVSTGQIKVEESSLLSDSKTSTEAASRPEPLPVISCVFSLSQQWEHIQNCPQPLLMTLRRIGMGDSTAPAKASLNVQTGNANKVDAKTLSTVHDQRTTPRAGHQEQSEMTEEHRNRNRTQTLNSLHVREENKYLSALLQNEATPLGTSIHPSPLAYPGPNRGGSSRRPRTISNRRPSGRAASHIDPFVAGGISGSVPQCETNKQDICPEIPSCLTIPLKRVKLDEDKTSKASNEGPRITLVLRRQVKKRRSKSHRLTSSKDSSGNVVGLKAKGYSGNFVGLKADQHIKQPGPNQPVVVLNLARPQALRRKAELNSITDSEVIPTCHILKMKLNKVMGRKYEVSGCTVRVCL